MDIAQLRKKPHLSVSSINTYMDCGLLYKFSRVDKVKPEFVSDNLVFGSCLHRVLAEYNQEKMMGNILSSDDLTQLFKKDWEKSINETQNIQYSKSKNHLILLDQGIKMLTEFKKSVPENNTTVIAIEEPFEFYINGLDIPLIGIMDLVEEDEDRTVIITDYKTSKRGISLDEVDSSFQLTIYYTAAKKNGYANRDIHLKFDCLIKTQKPRFEQIFTRRSHHQAMRALKKVKCVWDGIQKGIFIPNEGSWRCHGCAYKSYCNDWLGGDE